MTDYTVTAKRWEHGWELHIPDVGVTQARSLVTAEKMAKEYISLMLGVDESAVAVTAFFNGV
jgi:hypothetical protein